MRLGLLLVLLAIFAQSYSGRWEMVRAERLSCRHVSHRSALDANNLREDIANLHGDIAVLWAAATANHEAAGDPTLAGPLRRTRARESRADYRSIVLKRRNIRAKLREVRANDETVDQAAISVLSNRVDRQIARRAGFRCDDAFPSPSLLRFFG